MRTETLFWLSGLSLVIGGTVTTSGWVLFALVDPAHRDTETSRWLLLNALIIAGGIFMALGLPGFYVRQAEEAGLLGLLGFVFLFIGIVVPYVGVHSIETATAPELPPSFRFWVVVGAPSALVGVVTTGVATWLAGIYPQTAGIMLLLSAFAGLFTVVRSVPLLLRRNLLPATFTMTMVFLGLLLMRE